jgi:hypothetical protein
VNELVALGVIFDVPLANFFLPPEKPLRAVKMAQPEEEATAKAFLLGVKKLVKLALMDYSKDPLQNEFIPRAWNAARDYLGVEYHGPAFLDPELGLPQIRALRTPVPPLPADPDEDSTGPSDDAQPTSPEKLMPPMGVLQQLDEVAGRLTPEELRRYIRSEAISAAYEAYKKWENEGPPDESPQETETGSEHTDSRSPEERGSYPEEPPF